ncbi:other/FunK1 protein kinase [Coprinopsis cinerea AmutBmut pab1-1]|nr:other/FunK1 protein kinase [Coprinopsis cinerea AmutBmut pab1-1]
MNESSDNLDAPPPDPLTGQKRKFPQVAIRFQLSSSIKSSSSITTGHRVTARLPSRAREKAPAAPTLQTSAESTLRCVGIGKDVNEEDEAQQGRTKRARR